MSDRIIEKADDYYPGDPVSHVVGKPEEKSARRHRQQGPKPAANPLAFEQRLLRDIQNRMAEIEPLVKEIPRLQKALKQLEEVQ